MLSRDRRRRTMGERWGRAALGYPASTRYWAAIEVVLQDPALCDNCAGAKARKRKRKSAGGAQRPVTMRGLEKQGPSATAAPCGCAQPALETGNF